VIVAHRHAVIIRLKPSGFHLWWRRWWRCDAGHYRFTGAHRLVDMLLATRIDLARLIAVDKPMIRAQYSFAETGEPDLARRVDRFRDGLPAAGLR
jgi:hypothetical protein